MGDCKKKMRFLQFYTAENWVHLQTIYAGFPNLKPQIELLSGVKAEHSIEILLYKWSIDKQTALIF